MTEIAHRTVEANGIPHPSRRGGQADRSCSSATVFRSPGIRGAIRSKALAEAGYRAVAPDMRGYGQTDQPRRDRSATRCFISSATWSACSTRSARRRRSSSATTGARRSPGIARSFARPLSRRRRPERAVRSARLRLGRRRACRRPNRRSFYQLYFQRPASRRRSLSAIRAIRSGALLYSGSGDVPREAGRHARRPRAGHGSARRAAFSPARSIPPTLPAWLTEADIDFYAAEFAPHGLPRRAQLVSQHRPQLGASRPLRRRRG